MNNIIEIPDNLNNIVVLFSGGIDSTILLYLTAIKYPHKRITALTAGCSYVDNRVHLRPPHTVIERINWLVEPGAIDQHIIHYKPEDTGHHCSSALDEIHEKDPIDCVIIGQNLAPPEGTLIWKSMENRYEDLHKACESPSRLNPTGPIWNNFQDKWQDYRPIKYMDKKEVVQLYRDNNVFDELMPYTRSCTRTYDQNFKDNRLKTNLEHERNYKDHCGWCWYCMEREWGLRVD